ncbi:nucleotidyltransferase family protein [Magnetospira thiophila]
MTTADNPLFALMRQPERAADLSLAAWDPVIRLARRADVLARLCALIEAAGVLDRVPERPRLHLTNDRVMAEKQARDVRFELRKIMEALDDEQIPPILLKGAAYVAAGLPAARGRKFTDIDFLVRKELLGTTESALFKAGWVHGKLHPYDEKYYRTWMHQIPPVTHLRRKSMLDVHHTILPETARVDIVARKLRDQAVPVADWPGVWMLAPKDMLLHSAVHLFSEGDFERAVRDLSDMDLLLRHFGTEPGFWEGLVPRAEELDLRRPLYYALTHLIRLLHTPVPEAVLEQAQAGRPGPVLRPLMAVLFDQALRPPHELCRGPWTGLALSALYVRAHHLRMPPHLLIPHLLRKTLRWVFPPSEEPGGIL